MHILVIRLSALGDVAILEPVLRLRAAANPEVQFSLAGPARLASLFSDIPNVTFVATKKKQSPRELYRQLSQLKPTVVADMHHVNRVIGADLLFRLHGVEVHHIRKHNGPERPSWKRYDEVFDRCGLRASEIPTGYWEPRKEVGVRTIGIAPFAQHEGKIWPIGKMEELVARLSQDSRIRICLFGSREESGELEMWASRYPNVRSLAGKYAFEEELETIGGLDLMVSMDSSNMHFASCLGVPVVSIWGATHPRKGFYGWRQNPDWAVQRDDLGCRPCSRYGNKPCRKGDYPCLKLITVDCVYEKVMGVVGCER